MALIDSQGGSGTVTTTGEVTDDGPVTTTDADAPMAGADANPQYEDMFGRSFGDGSNRWIPGTVETLQGDGKNDIAGVFDAAALNFDEGVGGLYSLIDGQPGNTAGPGDTPIMEQEVTPEVQSAVDDTTDALTDGLLSGPALLIALFVLALVATYGVSANAV